MFPVKTSIVTEGIFIRDSLARKESDGAYTWIGG